ncbi:MAG: AAA family ATPase [Gammaproteobacteria bacterium]|nr:AAA family ATPase [Gammaproteobacteria bacterium]
MKTLTKIRLINWHYFENETINVKNNTLLTGQNASGKSTIMDAITFVITAGDTNFNLAANEKGKRDIRSYAKCKLGALDQEYLRDYDLTSHICLEYYSEKQEKYFCLGTVIDVVGEVQPPKVIFYIIDGPMKDEFFIGEDYEVRNIADFKKQKFTPYIFNTKREAKVEFRQKMGGISDKYFTLLPKALAFKPIADVKDYIYQHLLEKKEINTDNIKDSIRSYKEFESILKITRQKIEDLSNIKETYDKIVEIKSDNDFYDYLIKVLNKKTTEKAIESKNKLIRANELELDKLKGEVKEMDEKIANEDDRSKQVYASLSNNEDFKASEIYDRDIKRFENDYSYAFEKKREFDRKVKSYLDSLDALKNVDPKLYKEISKLNLRIESLEDAYNASADIDTVKPLIDQRLEQLKEKEISLNNLKNQKVEEIRGILDSLNKLSSKNTLPYPQEIVSLRGRMEEYLKKTYGETISVHILAEIIEVKDKSWQNTVEDLLGNQRFTLIVEPKYYDDCLDCYNEYKGKHLYGVNLLNTKRIQDFNSYQPNSLASIIETDNRDARHYINYSIGNLIMVESVRDLEKYSQSITKDGMLYRGFVSRYLNPNTPKPFIGSNAKSTQLENYNRMGEKVKAEFQEISENIQKIKELKDVLQTLDLSVIKELLKDVKDSFTLKVKIDELKEAKRRLSLSSVEELRAEYEKMLEGIRLLNQKKGTILQSEGAKRQANESLNNEILELLNASRELSEDIERIENEKTLYPSRSEELYEKERGLGKSEKEIQQEIEAEIYNEVSLLKSLEQGLTVSQIGYITKYNRPFGQGLDRIDDYLEELDKLVSSELVKYESKVRDAREEAEKLFKEDFLSRLRGYILDAQNEISKINETLDKIVFGRDKYQFIFPKSKEFGAIYDMITDNYATSVGYSIFNEEFEEKYQKELDELFNNLASDEENSEGVLNKYTDYRTYMDYDIKVITDDDVFYFSNISKEKSGGETQIPFYVAILASFVRLFDKAEKNGLDDSVGLILFDEVFDKMDSTRTDAMMEFISHLPVQIILACPPQKMESLEAHTDTTIAVFRENKKAGTFVVNNK